MANSSKSAKRERQRQNRAAKLEYEAAVEKRKRFWRSVRGFVIILIPIVVVFLFLALRNDDSTDSDTSANKRATELPAPSGLAIDPTKTYTATIETTEGTIEIALDAANAPNSVNNFVYLTEAGFYDGLLFNRAAENFVVQTGGPDNTAAGGPGYTIQAELPTDGYEIGSVAWAKTSAGPAGTAGSQFFIGAGSEVTSLPPDYGYIGKVTEGIDVVEKIASYAPASGAGKPTKDVKMKTVTITTS